MEHWVLASLPFAVRIWNWWALWKNTADIPVEEVRVVAQSLHVQCVIVQHNWSVALQPTADTSDDEVHDVEVGDPASSIKVLDRQLTDCPQTKSDSNLGTGGVVSIVEVGSVCRSSHFFHLSFREP